MKSFELAGGSIGGDDERSSPHRFVPALLSIFLLGGCALPRSGPGPGAFGAPAAKDQQSIGLAVVQADRAILEKLKSIPQNSLATLGNEKPINDTVGVGDVLSAQIYEPGSTGLFGAGGGAAGSSVGQFPRLVVDRDGEITVPFAGRFKVAGLTPTEVQKIIEEKLKGKAIQPQAVVAVTANLSNTATVGGDVKNPGRVPLSLAGDRVRDVVNLAGGPLHEPQDTLVQFTRGGETLTVPMQSVIESADENTYVRPGDHIQISYKPRSVTVFGAASRPSEIPLLQSRVNLAQTLARAGGLNDDKADPAAVYLFRFENPEVLSDSNLAVDHMPNGTVPIIYRVDLSEPQGFFIAQGMQVRDGDMLYLATTRSVEAGKFATLLRLFTGVIYDLRGVTGSRQ